MAKRILHLPSSAAFALCSLAVVVEAEAVCVVARDEQLMTSEGSVVAAVVVEGEQRTVGTQGNPPKVLLRIESVIHGEIEQSRLEAVWEPPAPPCNDEVYDPPVEDPPASWLAERHVGPVPGVRLILLLQDNGKRVSYRCQYPDSPEMRECLRRVIKDYLERVADLKRDPRKPASEWLQSWASRPTCKGMLTW